MTDPLRLNLGCGHRKLPGYLNVDREATFQPDRVVDLERFPWPWPDDSVREVLLYHVLEHLGETTESYLSIMRELWRITCHEAAIHIVVPHPRSDAFLNDPTHVRAVTRGGLELFDREKNRAWVAAGAANTTLGLHLGVDFVLESVQDELAEPWKERLAKGELSQEALAEALRNFNNVLSQSRFVLRTRKPEGQGGSIGSASERAGELLTQALAAWQQGEVERCDRLSEQALALDPRRADGWTLSGMARRKLGYPEEAINRYRRAMELQPDFPDPCNNLANLHREQGALREAVACYREALRRKPDFPEAWDNLGGTLQDMGEVEQAIEAFDHAIHLRPDYADAHWDRALALLLTGEFRRGWEGYEWRWQRGEPAPRPFPQPWWDGSDLNGRTLLVHAEQGLGDAIQFLRFLPGLKRGPGQVILEVQEPLLPLLRHFPGVDRLVARGAALPPFDLHIPLLSLPHRLGTTLESLPGREGYLKADPERVRRWQQRLEGPGLKVGLVWAGNPRVRNDRYRSPRLKPLLPLLEIPGLRFFALQKGDGRADLLSCELPPHFVDLGEGIGDLADTAAIMSGLDLVISSDTATAHLAGALGVPGWILLPFAPDWRWLRQRQDSPWYGSLTLFRQETPGDWPGVVRRVSEALRKRIPAKSATVTAATPAQVEALNRALMALQEGRLAEAETLSQQALQVAGNLAEAWTVSGMVQRRAGRVEEAIVRYGKALALRQDYPEAWANLGNAHRERGELARAEGCYRKALALQPSWPEVLSSLSDVLRVLERPQEAADCARQALGLRPGFAEAHNHLANALSRVGETEQALHHYREAMTAQPHLAEAHYNLGVALQEEGRHREAVSHHRRAVALSPRFKNGWYNLGIALQRSGDLTGAVQAYRTALEIDADHGGAVFNLAGVMNGLGRFEEALELFRRAETLQPGRINVAVEITHLQQKLCDWSGLEGLRERILEPALREDSGVPPSPFPFLSLPLPVTPEEELRIAARYAAHVAKGVKKIHAHAAGTGVSRLRVGYLSADFHNHATAHLMLGLFGLHDRKRFEIIAYSFGPDDGSDYRNRIRSDCDRFVDLEACSDAESAQRIHDNGVHLLIDLKGYTRDSRPEILAARPAPVQVAWLGYPGTMGADFIDWVITDATVTPAAQQAFYAERFAVMPHCYQVNDREQPIAAETPSRTELGLPEKGFVFCCFNTHYKIDAFVFDIWMRLLTQVPGSVLWLIDGVAGARQNLRDRARERGVDPQRLVFAPILAKPGHLARQHRADLFLDTRWYNAHTTASDALWAGLPLLTVPGERFAGRVCASILQAAGLGGEGLICPDFESYEKRALELARNPRLLQSIRQKLQRQRTTCPLFDTPRFTRDLEGLYESMWQAFCRGEGRKP
ncbi:MAG: tetratricopeptide repeat protein [Magnetococcales bacterium]|nr:tetratricopeptide repeat protein [Magnetococcales bacterium]